MGARNTSTGAWERHRLAHLRVGHPPVRVGVQLLEGGAHVAELLAVTGQAGGQGSGSPGGATFEFDVPTAAGDATPNAPRTYQIQVDQQQVGRNKTTVTLRRESWMVPMELPYVTGDGLVPLRAGEAVGWKLVEG